MYYYQRAWELYQDRRWEAARILLKEGLSKVEGTAESHHLLGVVLYNQGRFRASLKELKKACEIKRCPEYLLNTSIVLNKLGFYEEGQQVYDKAVCIQNRSVEKNWKEEMAEKHFLLAKSYAQKKHFKHALAEHTKSLSFNPSNKQVYLEVVKSLWELHQRDVAFKILRRFINRYPNYIPARLLLAEWYFETQQMPLAVSEWESVLYQDPSNEEASKALMCVQQLELKDMERLE